MMSTSDEKVICPHCGKQVNGEWKSLGNYSLADGWTSRIVDKAARKTGFIIEARKPTLGNSVSEYLSIWRKGHQGNLQAFWDRAKELRAEVND